MTIERLAFGCLIVLGLTFGLGDLGQANPFSATLRETVRALLPLSVALALVAMVIARRRDHVPHAVALPAGVWLILLAASAAWAPVNRADAFAALSRPVGGVLLGWAVFALATTPARWRALARAFTLGGLFVALVGLVEASGLSQITSGLAALHDGATPVGDVPRIAATLSHPNVAAIVLELTLPFLIAWAWTASSPRGRTVVIVAAACVLVALVLTFSRAGIIGALVGLAVLFAFGGQRRVLLPLLALTVIGAALAWAAVADPGLDRRLAAGLDESSPVQPARTQFWWVALEMQRDHPWLGVGLDNYRWQFASYSGIASNNLGIHAHNQYLEALADSGLLGLVAFAWLLGALVRHAWQAALVSRLAPPDWPWRATVVAALASWLVHALVDDFERFWPASVAFWLICGLSWRVFETQTALGGQQTLGRVDSTGLVVSG
ncbi:MAG TPA: O-antigen ligase family protein [Chloroflexota bacterium]|jgi:O-antigen ligase|nr:O-antigen ligase family protein [Chloroflexota bacterium]